MSVPAVAEQGLLTYTGIGLELVLVALALPILFYAGYTRVRRKGYPPPSAVLAVLAVGVLGLATTIALSPIEKHFGPVVAFAFYFWLPVLLAAVTMTLLVSVLPLRHARRSGQRQPKFPFLTVGRLLLGAAILVGGWVVAAMLGVVGLPNPDKAATLAGMLAVVGFYLIDIKRRLDAPSLEEALLQGLSAPVLYIRSFSQERANSM